MRTALACWFAVATALAAAAPAAAVPYEDQWKRAAEKARFKAVPGLGALDGLRPGGNTEGRQIDGQFEVIENPDEPGCTAASLRFRQVVAAYRRERDGAQLYYSWFGAVPPGCDAPEPDDLPGTRKLGRTDVLGERLMVDTFPLARGQVGYRVMGRIRGHRLAVQVNYGDDPGPAEIRRLAGAVRWVRP